MKKAFVGVILVGLLILATSVVVFANTLELTYVESLYFVVATMTTVGYGDINLLGAGPLLQIFGVGIMLSGAATVAASFGLITDFLLSSHFDPLLKRKAKRMKNHVIVCGLGKVGIRVLERLCCLEQPCVAIDLENSSGFLEKTKSLRIPVIVGDAKQAPILEDANIESASSIVVCTAEDLLNLEIALAARELNPTIRVVLRIFDPNLARRVDAGFGFDTAFSTSALSAPAFAMAAIDPNVVASFEIEEEVMLNIQIEVKGRSALDGISVESLKARTPLSLLSHKSVASGTRTDHPNPATKLSSGDTIVACISRENRQELHRLNTPN